MILTVVLIEIILFIIMIGLYIYGASEYNTLATILGFVLMVALIIIPCVVGSLHGYIDYKESNDKDLARITAVTQKQTAFKTYYKVEVEYLTNTPTQEGVVVNKNIEKDTFYCYYEDKELVEKLKNNIYKELWIISGYKGGYETYKDFGSKLIKDIQVIE